DEVFFKICRSIQEYNLLFVNQLIEANSYKVLLWKKFYALRAKSLKGHKPKWFRVIENYFEINQSRIIKKSEAQIQEPNTIAMKTYAKEVSIDKQKHEWVIVNKNQEEALLRGRYKNCKGKHEKSTECDFWVEKKNILESIQTTNQETGSKKLALIEEIVRYRKATDKVIKDEREQELVLIEIEEYTKSFIKLHGFDRVLEEILEEHLETNI
ncbi:16912_t:CDS:2, partial [Dentiscutata heterogama]